MTKLAIITGLMTLKMPAAVSSLLYVGRRMRKDGLLLDAKAQLICAIVKQARTTAIEDLTPAESRAQLATFARLLGGPAAPVAAVENLIIPGPAGDIPARLYRPLNAPDGPLPILVFYHGGGWIQGDLETHDQPCRLLANGSGGLVLSVDYRLAPEHKFPAGVDDALAAFRWVRDNGAEIGADVNRIAVGGDSAGGNLSVVVCQQIAQAGETGPMFQLLIYPATDHRLATHSFDLFADGFFLTRERIEWYLQLYMDDLESQGPDPRFSPIMTKDLSGQPPALIITAGFDPLRDEGSDYHQRLRAAGVSSDYVQYDGMIHAFINMAGVLPQGIDALVRSGAALKTAWAG
jgi:acetyl esterase